MDVLKDLLIDAGLIDRYFEDQVPVNLWRARKLKQKAAVFALVEEEVKLRNGQIRPADITIEPQDGEPWVRVRERPRGLSTFDRPDFFKRGQWEYYKIPAGTTLPAGLAIVKDSWNPVLEAFHYSIAPAHDMPLAKFKALLNRLAATLNIEVA